MELFAYMRTFNLGAVTLRLISAVICGSLIGLDREMRNKRAGLKTHTLVCLGAALCVIVSESINLGRTGVTTDMTRIAANVVTGVGFLCAATLIVKGTGFISGLTTAAGMWTTAIVGLACGAGWPEIAFIAVALIAFVFVVLSRIDERIQVISRGFDLYAELTSYEGVPKLLGMLHVHDVYFTGLQVSKSPVGDGVIVQLNGHTSKLEQKEQVIESLRKLDCVKYLEHF